MVDKVPYDEFSMFADNASEFGLPYAGPPVVRRESVELGEGRRLSALVWGDSAPEYVFIHGGAQNAHTWDTVLLAMGKPALAVDLPGHGHSDVGRSGYMDAVSNAEDVAIAIKQLAPEAKVVVGMSLGGLTTLALVAAHPEVVRRVVLVDVTPGVDQVKSQAIAAFVNGPDSFPDFDAILARTIEHNPTRTEVSLRRGILHNAKQLDDGTWVWRYARHRSSNPADASEVLARNAPLWDAVSAIAVPLMLVRGMRPQSVVDDADEAEVLRRLPEARIEHIEEAGHSVQGDTPVELADLIMDFAP